MGMKEMSTRCRKLYVAFLVTALVIGLIYSARYRIGSIAAVQNALERDWEISFDAGDRPKALPTTLDIAADDIIRRLLGPEPDPLFLAQKPNRADVWHERFRGLFRGRITEMEIYYPGRLRDDLGAALRRFPALRRLKIQEADFSASDWSYVFAGLHHLPHLEKLEIGGHALRDSTIERLANQRSIRKITITTGRLGTESVETFRRLPNLNELSFDSDTIDDGHASGERPFPEIQKIIRDALPKAKVEFL